MTKFIIAGAHGRIGQALLKIAPEFSQLKIVGEIGRSDDLNTIISRSDVVIDFSFHKATLDFAKICAKNGKALVIGTTGHTDSERTQIESLKSRIPIVWSSNYSVGVNVLFKFAREFAKTLGTEFDIEIVETHHRRKKDAPSGTAKSFLEILKKVREEQLDTTVDVKYGRPEGIVGERGEAEIGVHSIRGGGVICDHSLIFASPTDVVEVRQTAITRDAFAHGALKAAQWVVKQHPGLYDMQDVLGLRDSSSNEEGESYYSSPEKRELVTR
jgi:4-hydroxy-tetrahydrodipicolinate reductase